MSHRRSFPVLLKSSLFALLCLSTLALSALVSGCHRGGPPQEDPQAWTWQGDLVPPATIQIRNTNGPISVEPATDNRVSVVAAASWTRGDPKKDIQFQAVTSGTTLTICALWTRGECSSADYGTRGKRGVHFGTSTRSDARISFVVKVPAGVRVDASTIAGEVTVRASAPVRAWTIDGDIKVGTSVGPVNAETINGDVDVRMTTIGDTGAVRAVTKNGDAIAYVPEISDGRIDASTLNGELGSDFGSTPVSSQRIGRKLETTVGAGSRAYLVQSMNGSAWLRLINADGSVTASAPRPASSTKASTARIASPK